MSDAFRIDDEFFPVPVAAVDADPAKSMRGLFFRVARLEQTLADERAQGIADLQRTLLDLLSLSDDIASLVEQFGVSTSAGHVTLVRGVVAIGRGILAILQRHQVHPIKVVGKPVDHDTATVVGTEVRANVSGGTVVREEMIGYTWPLGLLRQSRVVISTMSDDGRGGDSANADTTLAGAASPA